MKTRVVVTGVSGNLGLRLLEELKDFDVVGVDIHPPSTNLPLQFESMDLGEEDSCQQLIELIRETRARAVVHLAFIVDSVKSDVLNADRMWRINVAGTGRVMEAISEVNRRKGNVETFVFPGSASVYGPETPGAVNEDHPLAAESLPYSIHKQECDTVVRYRASTLGACATYLLRPPIFVGPTVENYLLGILRGTATGKGKVARWLNERGIRLPLLLPHSKRYRQKKVQFIHIDDMARLIAHFLRQTPRGNRLLTLNAASAGESLTVEDCARIARQSIVQLPTKKLCQLLINLLWRMQASAMPPEAYPYMTGSFTVDTTALHQFLGSEYRQVIQHTIEEALKDTFDPQPKREAAAAEFSDSTSSAS